MLDFNSALFFILLIITWIIFRVGRFFVYGKTSLARELTVNGFFVYACYVIGLTFFPFIYFYYSFDHSVNLIPLVRSISMIKVAITQSTVVQEVAINLVGNLALLAPLGFILPVIDVKARSAFKILALAFVISFCIECSQYLLATRVSDIDDVILNVLGALIGFAAFKLICRIPPAACLVHRISQAGRKHALQASLAYASVALVTFLSIFTVQFVASTQSIETISKELSAENRQVLGMTSFDSFVSLFSQTQQGEKSVAVYFKVFLDRYTPFSNRADLQNLPENTYILSGMSKGTTMIYAVIARSSQDISQMVYNHHPYPVTKFGEYYFSYASEPITTQDHLDVFDFLDAHGDKMNFAMEQ
jgi:glycopeptide antibiotics resistance protein